MGIGARWVAGFGAAAALAGCASGGGMVGAVALDQPEAAHGDDRAIAWPFVVTHGGGDETFADFHLRIEEGGTLLGVRPDAQNPDAEARFTWRGSLRAGEGYWIGDPLPPGAAVRLWILVRPASTTAPRVRVVHWPTNGRDAPVGPQTCEIWTYDAGRESANQAPC